MVLVISGSVSAIRKSLVDGTGKGLIEDPEIGWRRWGESCYLLFYSALWNCIKAAVDSM